jgi:phosphohistidine phosphatase SixA
LTPGGEATLRQLGTRLAALGPAPGIAFASPLLRGRRSAQLLLAAFGVPPVLELLEELEPERDPDELLSLIERRGTPGSHVLVVGHMPHLGRLAERLTGSVLAFGTGTLHRIQCDGLEGRLSGRLVLTLEPEAPGTPTSRGG